MGHIDTEFATVSIDPMQINGTITCGDTIKSEIHITSENRISIRGFVYSSNPKVVLSCDNILGVFIHVPFIVDAERLSEGELIEGEFLIVTNAGEFVVPYSYVVVKERNEGFDISTIDGFYNLYLNNATAAKDLFLSPDFTSLPFMLEPRTRTLYDGLLEANDADNSLREFLSSHGYYIETADPGEEPYSQATREVSLDRLLLKDEIRFDHAKIDFETNDIMGGAALLEMQKAFKDLKAHDAPQSSLRFHKAEISYYKNYNRTKKFNIDRTASYKGLKRCFERGCRSPYLYLEACKALNEHPELLREYDSFVLQVINFGSKHGYLSADIANRLGIHAQASKTVQLMLLNSMKRIYKYYPTKELLSGIVSTLVKNESTDTSSFRWYLKAINEELQISRLYDYFIDSVPDDYDAELPKEVYLYYSYNSPSSDKGMKTLYSSVIRFFDKSSSTYLNMEMQIRRYVTRELFDGHIDKKLAIIYKDFLRVEMIDDKVARLLPEILMMHEVHVPYGNNDKLVVLYEELEGEQIVQLNSGKAKLPLYTNNYYFLIEDELGRRYTRNNISVYKYIDSAEDLLYTCVRYAKDEPAFRILEANEILKLNTLSEGQMLRLKKLADSEGIHALYRTKLNSAICNRFDWLSHKELSDVLTDCCQDRFISEKDKAAISDILIELDKSDVAESLIKKIGFSKIVPERLLGLCTDYIKSGKNDSDSEITNQSYYLYKSGVFNKETLSFLCKNYNGLCLDMASILLLAISEEAETFDMAERILAQMIFTNQLKDVDEIFKIYVENNKADKVLVCAYFVIKCYRYFINGEDVDAQIFESIKNVLLVQLVSGSAPIITMLAVSKYFSSMDELTDEDKKICQEIVSNLVDRGAIFPYLKKLSSFINLPEEVKDKTIAVHHAKEGDSVALILVPEDDEEEPLFLEMNYICSGLFTKPVLLFEGEYQPYQIRVTRDGVSTIAVEGELKSDIADCDDNRKFIRLNELLKDSDNPSDASWQEDMANYSFDKALNRLLFTN